MSTPHRHGRAAATAVSCALLLAACGSSSPSSSELAGGSTQAASLLRFSECMRSHGVSGFPDPSTSERGNNSFGIDGYSFNLPAAVNTQSPAYESADKGCGKLIGGGAGPARSPGFVAKARQAALAHARCMRAHGVPNFPDPTVNSNGQGITVSSGGAGIDPRSPAFQRAQKTCGPS